MLKDPFFQSIKIQCAFFQTARAAVNNFVKLGRGVDFSDGFSIKKCMQGNFNLKPIFPN